METLNEQFTAALASLSKTQKAFEATRDFLALWSPRVAHWVQVGFKICIVILFTTVSAFLYGIAEGLDLLSDSLETLDPENVQAAYLDELEESGEPEGSPQVTHAAIQNRMEAELKEFQQNQLSETVTLTYRDLQKALKELGASAKGTKKELQARLEYLQTPTVNPMEEPQNHS
jgi:hypothetical protein